MRGYRLLAGGALAILVLVSLGTGAFVGSLYAPQKNDYQTVGSDAGKSEPRHRPKNGLSDISGIDSLAERAIAQPHPADEQERKDRDLAAQESMSVFGYWNVWWMLFQTLLAGSALIALLVDLWQNRKSAERQQRAYITYTDLCWAPSEDKHTPCIIWENRGQTPALHIKTYIDWIEAKDGLDADFAFPRPAAADDGNAVAGPGQKVGSAAERPFPVELLLRAGKDETSIYLWGAADYFDMFNNPCRSEIAGKYVVVLHADKTIEGRLDAIIPHNNMT